LAGPELFRTKCRFGHFKHAVRRSTFFIPVDITNCEEISVQRIGLVMAALLLLGGSAFADPTGIWLVAKGYARIRIENCNDAMWGAVAWEQRPGGIDDKNPDASKRGRPTLGMPVLVDMKQTEPNKWTGQIYNSENGQTYSSYIALNGPDVLQVRGCFIICMGEDWTRVKDDQSASGPGATPSGPAASTTPRPPAAAKPAGPAPTSAQKPAANAVRPTINASDAINYETAAADDFCSMILNGTRATH
jgi:uncharacterized protein (DUF2147 family)